MQRLNSFPNSKVFAIKPVFSFFSSLSETQNSNTFLLNYLIETLDIPKPRALVISKRYPRIKSLGKPPIVCQFLQNVGFSDVHIRWTINATPQILFADVDKTLKPKIEFFQHLGFMGSDLGKFVSKNPYLLISSLERKTIPCVEVLKGILVNDTNNEDIIRVVSRCKWKIIRDPEKSGLLRNTECLKSCGIVGSQLSNLLVRQPSLFFGEEFKLRHLVSRVLDMGLSTKSRMFVYGLHALSCLSEETFDRKSELFRSYGFSREEFLEMFRKAPGIIRFSEERLKSGLEFFLKKIELEKAELFRAPVCLSYSVENRVIPRYRVFQMVMSRRLLKKKPSFSRVLTLSEENFLMKFVLRFGDDAEELLPAYRGHGLGSSLKEES